MERVIDSLMSGDTVAFKDQIHDILAGKLADRLEQEKIDVAERLFGSDEAEVYAEEDESEEDEGSGEDLDEHFFNKNELEALEEGLFDGIKKHKIQGHALEKEARASHNRRVAEAARATYRNKNSEFQLARHGKHMFDVKPMRLSTDGKTLQSDIHHDDGRYSHTVNTQILSHKKFGRKVNTFVTP
jgi:hypothetical protein